MKKAMMLLILGFLFSAMTFGAYLEIGRSPFTSMEMMIVNMFFYPKPKVPPPVFPAIILQQVEGIYIAPVSKHFAVTTDLEAYSTCMPYYNSFFVSGVIGVRYTSDRVDSFLGPLKAFAGINGGGFLLWGSTKAYPLVTADAGVSFKLTDTIRTFWDLKFYDSFSNNVIYILNPLLSGGIELSF